MPGINELWERVPPGTKRLLYLGGIVGSLVAVAYFVLPESTPYGRKKERTIENLLTDENTKNITLQSLAGKTDMLKQLMNKLTRQVDLLQAELKQEQQDAKPSKRLQKELAAMKAQINALTRKNNLLVKEMEGIDKSPDDRASTASGAAASSSGGGGAGIPLQGGVIPVVPSMAVVGPPAPPAGSTQSMAIRNDSGGPVKVDDISSSLPLDPAARSFFLEEAKKPRAMPVSSGQRGAVIAGGAAAPAGAGQMNMAGQTGESSAKIRVIASGDKGVSAISAREDRENKQIEKEKKKQQEQEESLFLPAGSILEAVIIAGMDAPTNQSARRDPFPALMRIKKDAILPNRFSADIRECFLLASGYGDMSSERVQLRGNTLSCVKEDGGVIESGFDSYVVGEDGKAGVRGRLVSRQGAMIAKSVIAGFAEGVAKAFDVQRVPTINTSSTGTVGFEAIMSVDAVNKGAIGGATSALERIANYYLDMAENLTPVIELDAGRMVTFVVTKGVSLKIK